MRRNEHDSDDIFSDDPELARIYKLWKKHSPEGIKADIKNEALRRRILRDALDGAEFVSPEVQPYRRGINVTRRQFLLFSAAVASGITFRKEVLSFLTQQPHTDVSSRPKPGPDQQTDSGGWPYPDMPWPHVPVDVAAIMKSVPASEHPIIGPPTVNPKTIDIILDQAGSPAKGSGEAFYRQGMRYRIDPVYLLAFFMHESTMGTASGWAGIKPDGSTTYNIGNIVCAGYPTCFNRFREYPSWEAGAEDWYRLLLEEYVAPRTNDTPYGKNAATVERIIPIYAPSSENNVPNYIAAVNSSVEKYRAIT